MNKRKRRHGALAAVLTAAFLVAVILVNIVATMLIDRFDLSIDLTGNKIHEMSQETVGYLQNYKEKTTIYILADEKLFKTASDEYTQAYNMIEKFRKHNAGIVTEYINLTESPDFKTKFPNESLQMGDVIVAGENGRYKKLSSTDLFQQNYDPTTYQVTETLSTVEQSVSSALEYISGANPVSGVLLTGHSEDELAGVKTLLEKNNYTLSSLSLKTGEIDPASTDLAVIGCPTIDYTPEEIAALEAFLSNNGSYGKSIVYVASATQPELPNLEAFLKKWGIAIQSGLVLELDQNLIYQYQTEMFVTAGQNKYTEKLTNPQLQILAADLKPMTAAEPTETGVTTTSIMQTSDTTALRPLDASSDWSPTKNDLTSFEVALAAEKTSGEATSRIVALSSSTMFQLLSEPTLNNGAFTLGVFNTAANKQSEIQIVPKSLTAPRLNISLFQSLVMMIIFVVLIPLAVLIVGLVVWLRRRNR